MRDINELGLRPRRGNPFPSVSDEGIRIFEEFFKIRLPRDYVNFLKFMNGSSQPRLCAYADPKTGGMEGLDRFYGLGTKESDDAKRKRDPKAWDNENLWGETRILRDIFGIHGIPIACDGGGNRFFITNDQEDSRQVNRLILATRLVYSVGDSFSKFIDMLIAPLKAEVTTQHQVRTSRRIVK